MAIRGYRLPRLFEQKARHPVDLFRHEGPPAAVFDREAEMRHARAVIVNPLLLVVAAIDDIPFALVGEDRGRSSHDGTIDILQ
jgi:hypothetical protein